MSALNDLQKLVETLRDPANDKPYRGTMWCADLLAPIVEALVEERRALLEAGQAMRDDLAPWDKCESLSCGTCRKAKAWDAAVAPLDIPPAHVCCWAEEDPHRCISCCNCHARKKQVQTSGPTCKNCGCFTTYKRATSHGLCMMCENDKIKKVL
jgi:hypothetical protein